MVEVVAAEGVVEQATGESKASMEVCLPKGVLVTGRFRPTCRIFLVGKAACLQSSQKRW